MTADEELTLANEDGACAVPEREEAPATQPALPWEVASQLIGILDDHVEQLKAGAAPPRGELVAAHSDLAMQ